jgi:hypothetical protein
MCNGVGELITPARVMCGQLGHTLLELRAMLFYLRQLRTGLLELTAGLLELTAGLLELALELTVAFL